MGILESEKVYIEQIIQEYEEGKKLQDIAKTRNTTEGTIKAQLLEFGGEKGKGILIKVLEEETGLPIRDIAEERMNNTSIKQLADKYLTNLPVMTNLLKQYETIIGEKIFKRVDTSRRKDLDLKENEIIEKYRKGASLKSLAKDYKTATRVLRTRFDAFIARTGIDIDDEHEKSIMQQKEQQEQEEIEISVFKLASLQSICKIIDKYGYSFKELSEEAEKRGYTVLKATYEEALEQLRSQGNVKKEGEEVEW